MDVNQQLQSSHTRLEDLHSQLHTNQLTLVNLNHQFGSGHDLSTNSLFKFASLAERFQCLTDSYKQELGYFEGLLIDVQQSLKHAQQQQNVRRSAAMQTAAAAAATAKATASSTAAVTSTSTSSSSSAKQPQQSSVSTSTETRKTQQQQPVPATSATTTYNNSNGKTVSTPLRATKSPLRSTQSSSSNGMLNRNNLNNQHANIARKVAPSSNQSNALSNSATKQSQSMDAASRNRSADATVKRVQVQPQVPPQVPPQRQAPRQAPAINPRSAETTMDAVVHNSGNTTLITTNAAAAPAPAAMNNMTSSSASAPSPASFTRTFSQPRATVAPPTMATKPVVTAAVVPEHAYSNDLYASSVIYNGAGGAESAQQQQQQPQQGVSYTEQPNSAEATSPESLKAQRRRKKREREKKRKQLKNDESPVVVSSSPPQPPPQAQPQQQTLSSRPQYTNTATATATTAVNGNAAAETTMLDELDVGFGFDFGDMKELHEQNSFHQRQRSEMEEAKKREQREKETEHAYPTIGMDAITKKAKGTYAYNGSRFDVRNLRRAIDNNNGTTTTEREAADRKEKEQPPNEEFFTSTMLRLLGVKGLRENNDEDKKMVMGVLQREMKFGADQIENVQIREGRAWCMVTVRGSMKLIKERLKKLEAKNRKIYQRNRRIQQKMRQRRRGDSDDGDEESDNEILPLYRIDEYERRVNMTEIKKDEVNAKPRLYIMNFDILNKNCHKALTNLFLRFGDLSRDIVIGINKRNDPYAQIEYKDMNDAKTLWSYQNINGEPKLKFGNRVLTIFYAKY